MKTQQQRRFIVAAAALAVATAHGCATIATGSRTSTDSAASAGAPNAGPPLASWHDTKARHSILEFVKRVTRPGPDFVPVPERIAVFDNDGTLWAEQPLYFQFAFAIDRVKEIAPQHPEWNAEEPFASLLRGDLKGALAGGEHAMLDVIAATQDGITTDEYEEVVRKWISAARHPTSGRPYTEMVYQPMLELLAYLRANGFKTFIVSGGGVDFMRVFTERVYGVPPEQVIGSTSKVVFEMRNTTPVLIKRPEFTFIDDKAGKPVGIYNGIGRRPIAAFGNSDGDLQMLQWTCDDKGPQLCLFVHHTDAKREWAYDRQSAVGRLDKGLDEAGRKGWAVVDMKSDWETVFPVSK